MNAVFLGLIAAIGWGLHDLAVRYVSQKTTIFAALLWVLLTGAFFQFLLMLVRLDFAPLPIETLPPVLLTACFFVTASIGLYKAFEIGPVRLVSPLIATFSIISVVWGALMGQQITGLQWAAVFAVFAGVSIVAVLSDNSETGAPDPKRNQAILWSLLSSVGFAGTFGVGQSAMSLAPDLMIILAYRIVAVGLLVLIMVYLKTPLFPHRSQIKLLTLMGLLDAIALACVLTAGNLENANYASVAASAFGMVTIILAWAFLKERITLKQWFGVLLAFSGIGYLAT